MPDFTQAHPGGGEPGSISSSLLARVRVQDAEAWRRLVWLYGPAIYGWCRRAGCQADDAADVVQDVFRSVLSGIGSFHRDRPGDSFRGWLWTITRNKLRDHARRRACRPAAFGGSDAQQRFLELPDALAGAADSTGSQTLAVAKRAVELVRNEFEESTWQAFWRLAIEGHSAAAVAEDLGMTEGAVRQAKYRVLRRLRDELS